MKQQGFTLIELIMVIVILGILAATALPKFSDLTADARLAKMNGLLGSLKAGAAMAHGSTIARSQGASSSVTMEDGTVVGMAGYYPAASASGIINVTDASSYASAVVAGTSVTFYPDSTYSGLDTCKFIYYPATAGAALPASRVPFYDTSGISTVAGCA